MFEKLKTPVTHSRSQFLATTHTASKHIRSTTLYIIGIALVAGVWALTSLNSSVAFNSSERQANTESHNNTIEVMPPKDENIMDQSAPGQSTTKDIRSSISSDTSGSTVTVNGHSYTVGPNESFNKTYTSYEANGSTHIDVSVNNSTEINSSTRLRSESHTNTLNIRTHSSTENHE